MLWALKQNDPNNLLYKHEPDAIKNMLALTSCNDNEFVDALKKYKAAARYHDNNVESARRQCEPFINDIEARLTKHHYIMGDSLSLVDYATLPFIRQFSRVDRKWFTQAPYPKLRCWLEKHYQDPIFAKAMTKYSQWLDSNAVVIFGRE
ncbi:Putative glutathione S-transferase [hydrothermal vent metagenome]|uniref:Glutathione S-transferase n=1 Tax=hydrothermal vent metagenome TaxID=652676 RepID=A0A3B0ZES5_9ZZZZ